MSEQITTMPPPPAWLRERFIRPGEKVLWWQGPREGPWVEWALNRHDALGILFFLGFFFFPIAGAALVGLCGGEPGAGFFCGGLIGIGSAGVGVAIWVKADKHVWQVVTDQRLLIVKARKVSDEFDMALLRRLLGAGDGALPRPDAIIGALPRWGVLGAHR